MKTLTRTVSSRRTRSGKLLKKPRIIGEATTVCPDSWAEGQLLFGRERWVLMIQGMCLDYESDRLLKSHFQPSSRPSRLKLSSRLRNKGKSQKSRIYRRTPRG